MKIFTELRREHELIDRVAGAMRTWASRAVHDDAPLEDGRTFIRFFEVYTGRRRSPSRSTHITSSPHFSRA
jgi:hypothetical protein